MQLSELDYDLPAHLIAQAPLPERDQARLLILDRRTGAVEHSRFGKLEHFLREGDLLVLNNTRVLPARLHVYKPSGARIELLLVRSSGDPDGRWLAMRRARRPLRCGAELFVEGRHRLTVAGFGPAGRLLIEAAAGESIEALLREHGQLALPHYIQRELKADDADDYQTVYADAPGAIAAPTAGLHFTDALLQQLAVAGIGGAYLTLHIGPGTFVPVRAREIEQHAMEAEWYVIPEAAQRAIEHARRIGGRVIAVGTSSARALESWSITGEREGFTGLFITPGFRFKALDGMITNFHMPRSTVLALVMALAGRAQILKAYEQAIRHRYRFLSYGDAMLIL